MAYLWALISGVLRVLFWPPSWWARAWHGVIAIGAWFAPEVRELLEMTLADLGIPPLENWHYYLMAAALAILTLAVELSRMTTLRIVPKPLRYTYDDNLFYVKLPIWNRSAKDARVYVALRIKIRDEYYSIKGRDVFVLLTQQRVAERIEADGYDQNMRRRFNLNGGETKDIELCRVNADLQSISIPEEVSGVDKISLSAETCRFELEINAGTSQWRGYMDVDVTPDVVSIRPCWLRARKRAVILSRKPANSRSSLDRAASSGTRSP